MISDSENDFHKCYKHFSNGVVGRVHGDDNITISWDQRYKLIIQQYWRIWQIG